MKTTLDTVCLKRLARKPKPPRGAKHGSDISRETGLQRLEKHIKEKKVRFYVDKSLGLFDEWERTCGRDVRSIVDAWGDLNGFVPVTPVNSIPEKTRNKLAECGFQGGGDRLVLKITLAATEKRIVSDDHGFWNPKDKHSRGDANAVVCKFLRDNHNIEVMQLLTLMNRLSA